MLEPEPVPKRLLLAVAVAEVVGGGGVTGGLRKVPEAEGGGVTGGENNYSRLSVVWVSVASRYNPLRVRQSKRPK